MSVTVLEGNGDFDLRFDGRTLVVECVFDTLMDPQVLSERVGQTVAGPQLRMVCGGISRLPLGFKTKTFINTDEDDATVALRVQLMRPTPRVVAIAEVDLKEAKVLWKELQRLREQN